jgi:5-methylcytosine-specific restriction endonuclease McrA
MSLSDNVSKTERICRTCSKKFLPISNRQLTCKVCNPASIKRDDEDRRRADFSLQKSKSSNGWKNGIGVYRLIGKKSVCGRCSSKLHLVVHHKDGDRTNNEPSNLQTLCKKCHQLDHKCWEVLPRGKELSKLKKAQAAKAKRDRFGRFIKN